MAKYIRMVIVLSVITTSVGLILGALNEATYQKAADNILKFKKIPAVADIYEAIEGVLTPENRIQVEEKLLAEKTYLDLGEIDPALFFLIQKEQKPYAVTFEKFGQGFSGLVGVMIGFNLETDRLVGIGITTLSETPGIGSRVQDKQFSEQFLNMKKDAVFKIKKDGGDIDGVSGATISSKAVAQALSAGNTYYQKHHIAIKKALIP